MSEPLGPAPSTPPPVTPLPSTSGVPRWLVATLIGAAVVIIGLLVVVVVLLAGGGDDDSSTAKDTTSSEPKTFDVAGDITLTDSGNLNVGSGCLGQDGYDDMRGGTQVVVTDASGTTLAVGALTEGVKHSSVECVFSFKVADVPEGQGPFNIEISHRGTIAFTRENATDIHLTLS